MPAVQVLVVGGGIAGSVLATAPAQRGFADATLADICTHHPATTDRTVQFFVIPTFPSIPGVVELARPVGIAVGAQDLHWKDTGPFTGEVSGTELAEIGCIMVEVGHAERRALFGKTDEIVARKTLAALRNGLAPVLCIGEPERAAPDQAAAFCIRQLESALGLARAAGVGCRLLVAYEPIWAIGAAEPAAPEYVTAVCRALRDHIRGGELLPDSQVIYGGSAGPGLLPRIAADVDGIVSGPIRERPERGAAHPRRGGHAGRGRVGRGSPAVIAPPPAVLRSPLRRIAGPTSEGGF